MDPIQEILRASLAVSVAFQPWKGRTQSIKAGVKIIHDASPVANAEGFRIKTGKYRTRKGRKIAMSVCLYCIGVSIGTVAKAIPSTGE